MWMELVRHFPYTWSSTDKGAGITVFGYNITGGGSTGYTSARTAFRLSPKARFYFECTMTTVDCGIGIANASAALTNYFGSDTNGCTYYTSGTYSYAGSQSGTVAVSTNGNLICIAVDGIAGMIWTRVGATGNWNASASNNPSTNVGGFACPGVFSGPIMIGYSSNQSSACVLNPGSTAFGGTVPIGFVPANAQINY